MEEAGDVALSFEERLQKAIDRLEREGEGYKPIPDEFKKIADDWLEQKLADIKVEFWDEINKKD